MLFISELEDKGKIILSKRSLEDFEFICFSSGSINHLKKIRKFYERVELNNIGSLGRSEQYKGGKDFIFTVPGEKQHRTTYTTLKDGTIFVLSYLEHPDNYDYYKSIEDMLNVAQKNNIDINKFNI